MVVWQLMDSSMHYSQEALSSTDRVSVSLTFVEVESKHLGHIARVDHFFNLCFEWKVAHLSVWCCLNLTGNDAVSCNVNLNFRILFPQWSYSTNDSPSKGCSLSMWIISLSWHTSSAVIAQEHLRSIRSPTPTSLFKSMIFSEIFWRWGQIRTDSGLGMTLPSWYRGSWVAFGQTNFYIFVIAMYNKAFDPLAFDNLLWKDCW